MRQEKHSGAADVWWAANGSPTRLTLRFTTWLTAWAALVAAPAAHGAGVGQEASPVDLNCAFLADTAQPLPDLDVYDAAADDRPVPRQLHQVWFGAPHPVFAERMHSWRGWAAAFGYDYKIWQAGDLAEIRPLMPVANAQALAFHLEKHDYRAASDLVRLTVLDLFGGIYLDSDLQPPSDDVGFFDLDGWIPMRGLTALSENEARQTGEVGTFLTNCLLAAPARHPLVAHLVDGIAANHHAWCSSRQPIAAYATGPFALTRALTTAVNVVPMDESYAWHFFGHTHRPDSRAWPLDARQGPPQSQLAADCQAASQAASRGLPEAWRWLRAAACLGGQQAQPAEATFLSDAAEIGLASPVDCHIFAQRALVGWRAEGQLRPDVLGEACFDRMLARCAGRQTAAGFTAAEVGLWWAAPRENFIWPAGDGPPYHPVPPGRRHPGGPDRSAPEAAGIGRSIPPLLHLVAVGDDGENGEDGAAARLVGWSHYAQEHNFTLRCWGWKDLPALRDGVAGDLAAAIDHAHAAELGPAARAAMARGLGLAALASEGGALVGPTLTPPSIDLRRLVPWRNAAIVASPHSPTYRGIPADLSRCEPQRSEALFDSGRGQALGSNATAVYPGFLAAAREHRWIAHLAGQAALDLRAVADGQLPAGLVLGEAALSRSLGGAVTLIPMRMAVHAGLVGRARVLSP